MVLRRTVWPAAAVVVAAMLTACGPDTPTREEAVRQARAAPVRQAGQTSAAQMNAMLSTVARQTPRLTPVATSTTDICHMGLSNGFWGHDPYRLICRRDEKRYLAADGDLLDALRELDTAARSAGLSPDVGASVEDAARYLAADGKNEDGLLLPKPRLRYDGPREGGTFVEWSQVSDPRSNEPDPGMSGAVVFNQRRPVDLDALWSGRAKGRRYLISISSSVTYYEIPWPA